MDNKAEEIFKEILPKSSPKLTANNKPFIKEEQSIKQDKYPKPISGHIIFK